MGMQLGHREEGALERQDPVSIAAGAFGKQDQVITLLQARHQLVPLSRDMPAVALDEYGALQLGQPTEQGPPGNLGLGDEAPLDQRAQNRDVEVRTVVDHE